jgi:hypothetical protein
VETFDLQAQWLTNFQITRSDIEHLFSEFLEHETPKTARALARDLIEYRIASQKDQLRKQIERGELFQPKATYKVGQKVVFPSFGYAIGEVVAERAGNNPDYGDFTVIEVEFENKQRHEFASQLTMPHVLNADSDGGRAFEFPDPDTILDQLGDDLIDRLEGRLVDEDDAIFFGGKWFLRSLLANVNVGHLHLAEAILDINNGGPMLAEQILKDVELAKEVPPPLQEFSLNVAMSEDERFDNVGPTDTVLWFLRRGEPSEVQTIPPRLVFHAMDYNQNVLTPDLVQLEKELDDEFSDLEAPETPQQEIMITLIYPHRRVGTLPLSSRLLSMLPESDNPHLRITLVNGQTGEEFAGWVSSENRYIFGLDDFYRRNRLPIGGYVTIRKTESPIKFVIDFDAHRPRTEYIRLAVPVDGKLTFANHKRSIGAGYDEFLIVGAEDLDAVDTVWTTTRDRRRGLVEIMRDLIPELAKLNPQNAVHAKTLYSAVNIVRRCPPGPIFAALVNLPEFQSVGGSYWRIAG